jgi:D-arabinose 1-dehydrogenase-like Zn-dependent alcohol dehydrogenase
MAEQVLASTIIAPKTFESREYPMPDISPDAGLLRVEATGVCSSDVHQQSRMRGTTHILGHEIVGRIARLGSQATRKWPFDVGLAIRTVAGDGVPSGIHVSVLPWSET